MTDLLGIGSSALLAYQRMLNTAGHNVANAATPGYSRQRVDLASRMGGFNGAGFAGAGVGVVSMTRLADVFANARLVGDASNFGRANVYAGMAARVDQVLSADGASLSGPLNEFFTALDGVAADPQSIAARSVLLGRAQQLATRFTTMDSRLQEMGAEVDGRLQQEVSAVNGLTERIADLNARIADLGGSGTGAAPNDLLDERDRLVGELASHIGVRTATQDDGSVNVYLEGGQSLVLGHESTSLSLLPDEFDARRLQLAVGEGADARRLPQAGGGSIGGLFEFRRESLDSARAELGRVAAVLAGAVNQAHAAGIDLGGNAGGALFTVGAPTVSASTGNAGSGSVGATITTPSALTGSEYLMTYDGAAWQLRDAGSGAAVPMTGTGTVGDPFVAAGLSIVVGGAPAAGDRFMVRPTTAAAAGMGVAITDPSAIAAAGAGTGTADNSNARALAALRTAQLVGGTQTLSGAYSALVADAGGRAQQLELHRDAQAAIREQDLAAREAVSGVNLDEEAADLVRFQQAYQAAAQIISTADTVFQSLLAATRR